MYYCAVVFSYFLNFEIKYIHFPSSHSEHRNLFLYAEVPRYIGSAGRAAAPFPLADRGAGGSIPV